MGAQGEAMEAGESERVGKELAVSQGVGIGVLLSSAQGCGVGSLTPNFQVPPKILGTEGNNPEIRLDVTIRTGQ